MKKLRAAIIGFGARGLRYSEYALKNPDELEIVAVAEPIDERRKQAEEMFNIKEEMLFADWKELIEVSDIADFIILATQDKMHYEPALAIIDKGYDLLLEKPMAPTPEETKKITEAAEKKGVKVVVCHVLRYTDFWCKVKEIIDSGKIGKIMSMVHIECLGHHHQAHSYVRGNWGNTKRSAPMILAKSCHDTDLIQWLIGEECTKVTSFGSLGHFTKENMPKGAPERCSDGCPYSDECYYDAVKYYYDNKTNGWRDTVANKPNPTDEEVMEALKTGPYGKCVYNTDNDVVDHQVVNMEFESGCTVSFSMNPFGRGGRKMRIYGTKGELNADMGENTIEILSFDSVMKTGKWEKETYNTKKVGEHIDSGHGGGDAGIMRDLIKYLRDGEKTKSISDIRTSCLSHLIAFAAEESRLTGKTVDVDEYSKEV